MAIGKCAKPSQPGEKSDKESKMVRSSFFSIVLRNNPSCDSLKFLSVLQQEAGPSRKRKSSSSLSDVEGTCCIYACWDCVCLCVYDFFFNCVCCFAVEDEESTIEEQEATEVAADQKAELAQLTKEGEF